LTPFTWLLEYLRQYSRLGIFLALIWLIMNRPFGRHVFITLSAMALATLMLPNEMMFFARHPELALGVPFTAGFAGAHMGRSIIGTVATWIVLGVLAVAIYRASAGSLVTANLTNLAVGTQESQPRIER
jgi:hypothetical protein